MPLFLPVIFLLLFSHTLTFALLRHWVTFLIFLIPVNDFTLVPDVFECHFLESV